MDHEPNFENRTNRLQLMSLVSLPTFEVQVMSPVFPPEVRGGAKQSINSPAKHSRQQTPNQNRVPKVEREREMTPAQLTGPGVSSVHQPQDFVDGCRSLEERNRHWPCHLVALATIEGERSKARQIAKQSTPRGRSWSRSYTGSSSPAVVIGCAGSP